MSKVFKVIADSSFEPFTLSEAKVILRVDFTADDDLITSIIKQCRYRAEQYTGIAITLKTVLQRFNAFSEIMQLGLGNPNGVNSIKYLDVAGDEQTLPTTVYGFDAYVIPGEVYRRPNAQWPDVLNDRGVVRIEYGAGWADAASIPADIKGAISLMISDAYEKREDSISRFPTAAQNYLELHRMKYFG